MFTKFNLSLLCVVSCVALRAHNLEIPQKISYIDSWKIMTECDAGRAIALELEKMKEDITNDIRKEAESLAKKEQELRSKQAVMKPEVYSKEIRKLEKERADLQAKVNEADADLQLAMKQKTEPLALELERVINEIALEQNVDIVQDINTGRVVYRKELKGQDFDGRIIECLNAKTAKHDKAPAATLAAQADTHSATTKA